MSSSSGRDAPRASEKRSHRHVEPKPRHVEPKPRHVEPKAKHPIRKRILRFAQNDGKSKRILRHCVPQNDEQMRMVSAALPASKVGRVVKVVKDFKVAAGKAARNTIQYSFTTDCIPISYAIIAHS